MNDSNYLKNIHRKIKLKKIKNIMVQSAGFLCICIATFMLSQNTVQDDFLFTDLYESVSMYEWEIEDDLSVNEIYLYLIDNTCLEDYDTIDDENMLELIENLNLGG